jgi:hypothetical protein
MTIFNERGGEKILGAFDIQNPAPLKTYALDHGGYAVVQNFVIRYFDAFGSPVGSPIDLNPRPLNDGNPFPRTPVPVDIAVLPDGSYVFGSKFVSQYGTSINYGRFDRDSGAREGQGFQIVNGNNQPSPSVITSDGRVVFFQAKLGDVGRDVVLTIADTATGQKIERVLEDNAGGQPRLGEVVDIGNGRVVASWLPDSLSASSKARIIDSVGNLSAVLDFGQNGPKFFDTEAGFGSIQSTRSDGKNQFVFKFFDNEGGLVREFTTSDGLRLPSGGRDNSLQERPLDVDVLGDGSLLVVSAGSTSDNFINPRVYNFDQNGVAKIAPIALPFATSLDAKAIKLENGDVFISYLQSDGRETGYKAKLFDVVYTEASDARTLNATTSEAVDLGVGTDHVVYAANRAGFQIFQPDSAGNGAEIARLYDHFLGRAPDAGGFDYWLGQLQGGQSLLQVAQRFADSDEFRNNWSGLSDRAFVEEAYLRLFERTGDKGGVDYWTERIASDGRAGVLLELSKAEAADDSLHWRNETVVRAPNGSFDKLTNVERVVFADGIVALDLGRGEHTGEALRMYDTAFDRGADRGGLTYWTRQLDAGLSLKDMAQAFINSAEGTDLRTASNTDFVKALYQRGLEREADSGGLNYWVGRVAADGKAAVLAEISESAEHFQLLQDQITTPVILDKYTIPGV